MKKAAKMLFIYAIVLTTVAAVYSTLVNFLLVLFDFASLLTSSANRGGLFDLILKLIIMIALLLLMLFFIPKLLALFGSTIMSGRTGGSFVKRPFTSMLEIGGEASRLMGRSAKNGLGQIAPVGGLKKLAKDLVSADSQQLSKAAAFSRYALGNKSASRFLGKAAVARLTQEYLTTGKLPTANDGQTQDEKAKENTGQAPKKSKKSPVKGILAENPKAAAGLGDVKEEEPSIIDHESEEVTPVSLAENIADEFQNNHPEMVNADDKAGNKIVKNIKNILSTAVSKPADLAGKMDDKVEALNSKLAGLPGISHAIDKYQERFGKDRVNESMSPAIHEANVNGEQARAAKIASGVNDPEVAPQVALQKAAERKRENTAASQLQAGLPQGSYPKDVIKLREDLYQQTEGEEVTREEAIIRASETIARGNVVDGITLPEKLLERNEALTEDQLRQSVMNSRMRYISEMNDNNPNKQDFLNNIKDQNGEPVGDKIREVQGENIIPLIATDNDGNPIAITDTDGNLVVHDMDKLPSEESGQEDSAISMMKSVMEANDDITDNTTDNTPGIAQESSPKENVSNPHAQPEVDSSDNVQPSVMASDFHPDVENNTQDEPELMPVDRNHTYSEEKKENAHEYDTQSTPQPGGSENAAQGMMSSVVENSGYRTPENDSSAPTYNESPAPEPKTVINYNVVDSQSTDSSINANEVNSQFSGIDSVTSDNDEAFERAEESHRRDEYERQKEKALDEEATMEGNSGEAVRREQDQYGRRKRMFGRNNE